MVQLIAGESEESLKERESLTKKLVILKKTQKILHRLDRHKSKGTNIPISLCLDPTDVRQISSLANSGEVEKATYMAAMQDMGERGVLSNTPRKGSKTDAQVMVLDKGSELAENLEEFELPKAFSTLQEHPFFCFNPPVPSSKSSRIPRINAATSANGHLPAMHTLQEWSV
jgi:hypothetical protein